MTARNEVIVKNIPPLFTEDLEEMLEDHVHLSVIKPDNSETL